MIVVLTADNHRNIILLLLYITLSTIIGIVNFYVRKINVAFYLNRLWYWVLYEQKEGLSGVGEQGGLSPVSSRTCREVRCLFSVVRWHVIVGRYHGWMQSAELRAQTASEPLTLEQEYEMQKKWMSDSDSNLNCD